MKVRTKPDKPSLLKADIMDIRGHLDGKKTYLWFGYSESGDNHRCIGTLSGHRLYRLAKAIVEQFDTK